MPPTSAAQDGFTLVEVLIALAITVIVAVLAYSGISTVLSGADSLRSSSQNLLEINRALSLINRDLRYFSNRPIRDEFGDLQPALSGGPLTFFPLMLTRDGWHNGQALPRSDLQRVYYFLEEGALWRAYYTVLDRAVDTEPRRLRLLEGVEEFELRFLDSLDSLTVDRDLVVDTRNWARDWVAEPAAQSAAEPPVALEIRLQIQGLGEVRRMYAIPFSQP